MLHERGVEPEVVEYLKTPLSAFEVEALIKQLGGDAHAIVRSKEEAYKTSKLSKASTAKEIAIAIAQEPILLERPIVVVGNRAAIGRPKENVLALL